MPFFIYVIQVCSFLHYDEWSIWLERVVSTQYKREACYHEVMKKCGKIELQQSCLQKYLEEKIKE